ncbi:MAG: DNA primase DnaG [Candidatus Pacearchaeota archaeon]|nr:DNA primase DnaG [Candidatus Pacearchaeota archaeon]
MIYANFKAEGPLEKPDVIGAIFGQTEGLLGSELEMRELQKEGKIGRIEVELETIDGKSIGKIKIPSALDRNETTLIAAAIETIDRIGPTEAKIEIEKIEDVRGTKREFILSRAKKLLEELESKEEFEEMAKSLKEEARASKIQEYGEEKLPAGEISGNEIIVVEGRADVVNLLKNRVNNVIGMNGTKLPKTIKELGREKVITLFIDGDRGGKLIAKNVIENANIAFVAIAPDGKEVEELTGKEILMALRKKMSVEEYMKKAKQNGDEDNHIEKSENQEENEEKQEEAQFKGNIKEALRKEYEKIKGTGSALLLDSNLGLIKKTSAKEVAKNISYSKKKIFAVIIDGTALSGIMKACDENGVSYLAATNFADIEDAKVNLVSL